MAKAKNRRPQTAKAGTRKAVRATANPQYVATMQGLRSSNAATAIPSGKTYRRVSQRFTEDD